MEWVEIVKNVGFPIAVALVCFVFIFKIWEQSKERENTYIEMIQKQNERFDAQDLQLQAIVLTQEKIIERLENIEKKEREANNLCEN